MWARLASDMWARRRSLDLLQAAKENGDTD
jgi:hypothetical protein